MSALAASAKRGKWVAARRIFARWLGWAIWRIVLPVVGLATILCTFIGLVFWQYMGHDAAYVAAQKWVQQELGSFQVDIKNDNTRLIPLTDEATPDLQLDHRLTIQKNP